MAVASGIGLLLSEGIATEFQIAQLAKFNFVTIADVAHTPIHKLASIPGISTPEAQNMLREASRYVRYGFRSASDLAFSQSAYFNISTGSSDLDSLIGNNGVEQGVLLELAGESASGKSMLCHQLSVTVQLPVFCGGGAGRAAFIDTSKTFRPEIICNIAKRYGIGEDAALANISVARCHNIQHLFNLLAEAKKLFMQNRYCLLIIDNVTSLLRAEFDANDGYQRQKTLAELLQQLRLIISQFSITVIFCVEMVANFGSDSAEANVPSGGLTQSYFPSFRLLLRRHYDGIRSAELTKSPNMPPGRVFFRLAHDGIHDV